MTLSEKKTKTYSTLSIDSMFFYSAKSSYQISKDNLLNLKDKDAQLNKIEHIDYYDAWNWGDDIDIDFSNETINFIESTRNQKNECFRNHLQSIASVHVFSIASLEAHINRIGSEQLKGKMFNVFERMSLEGKWLLLPKILQIGSFDVGNSPFQNFSKLIKTRNSLIHYKNKKISHNHTSDINEIYKSLGLDLVSAKISIETVENMVASLSSMLKQEKPAWIDGAPSNYLNIIYER